MKLIQWGSVVMQVAAACPQLARELPNLRFDIEAEFDRGGAPAIAHRLYGDMPPRESYSLDYTIELLATYLANQTRGEFRNFITEAEMKDHITAALSQSVDLAVLLRRVRKANNNEKLEAWCDRHDIGSISSVSEFVKHGRDARQSENKKQQITKAILDDARALQLI